MTDKKQPNIVIAIDDYHKDNLILAELIKSYGLESKTIFFIDLKAEVRINRFLGENKYEEKLINTKIPSEVISQIRSLDFLGFEIGGHNLFHDNELKNKDSFTKEMQIFGCKKEIERLTGKPCKHYAYNRGRYDEEIKDLVKRAGFEDARGTKVLNIKEPTNLFDIETTIHCFERAEYNKDWLEMAKEYYDKSGYFYLWGHASELMRDGELDKFKEILKYIDND